MNTNRKITVLLPDDLIERAMTSSGEGLTQTLRRGLELVAAKDTFDQLKKLKGKYRGKGLGISLTDLREDRK